LRLKKLKKATGLVGEDIYMQSRKKMKIDSFVGLVAFAVIAIFFIFVFTARTLLTAYFTSKEVVEDDSVQAGVFVNESNLNKAWKYYEDKLDSSIDLNL
jgi:hypothetical protein